MSNAPVAGMNYPTQKGMLAGNPRDSAIQAGTNSDVKLANMGKIGGKRKGGATNTQSTIPVPQYQMLYTPQGGNSSDPNAQIQQNSQISTQGAANAVYDKQALKGGYKKGGSKKRKTRRTRTRRTRKYRNSKRHRRH
jgi:hypothetical protein